MDELHVICLCAAWCGTCREFQPAFDALRARFPAARFEWIDVEDEADRVGDLDVDDFPMIVIARAGAPVFVGSMRPSPGVLQRAIEQAVDPRRDVPIEARQRESLRHLLETRGQPDPRSVQ